MKKAITLLLAFVLLFCMVIPSLAASDEAKKAADSLHELGLFNGVGTNADGTPDYDLDRTPTRNEAITMLVRLLGKEDEAKSGTWNTPFNDDVDWAKPYVGYAYTNKLTNGTSDSTFGGDALVSATQYITFVLRALGYDSSKDFQWDKAWLLSDKIGFTSSQYGADTTFLRGDVAIISNNALLAKVKGQDKTLLETLGLGNNNDEAISVYDYLVEFTKE
ncbi:MAG: S-layer homology domain-containing protein, partial [Oscillospiraceae bacterium]|nr:S-layer homology domain-containing protein [Oscillospiraceae bacterium]